MYQYHTLSNGIRIVLRRTTSPVAYSGVYINVGSRDESPSEQGIAHFIEHSIFKGTEHRRAYHILNRIDGVGGELNAFTTKEETCVYAISLGEHLERCLDLFADVLFHSVFPERELTKEKDVIIEEINSYRDSPSDLIFDDFEERIYGSHPLAHNILGSKRNVKAFTPAAVRDFMRRHYTTDRMAISVVADVDFDRLIRLCERYFGSYPPCESSALCRTRPSETQRFEQLLNRHTHQMHLLFGCPAPNIYEDDKVAFTLLNNIIGGPAMNSLLNVAIRERYGFCYSIESQYVPFSDAGLFYIYAGIEADAFDRVRELTMQELGKLAAHPLSSRQFLAAQRQLIGQMAISNDNGLNEMQSIGKACLNYGKVDTLDEMSADIMALTANDLQQVAARYLDSQAFSLLCYK
ncbi:MAG: insulinase family protein [Bacteroidales bacterium]|nr:insulinase family protein [Bacteroidales bacterium]